MSEELAFRPIEDGDVDETIALWAACGLARPWNDPVKDIAFARGKPGSEVLVARLDGRLAASVMVGHDGHRGMVYYVSVDPRLQGQGLGLLVRAENEKVRSFYESLGYEVEPRLCMARKLIQPEG